VKRRSWRVGSVRVELSKRRRSSSRNRALLWLRLGGSRSVLARPDRLRSHLSNRSPQLRPAPSPVGQSSVSMSRRSSFGSRFDQGPPNVGRPQGRYDDRGDPGPSTGSGYRGGGRGGGPSRQHNASKPYASSGRPSRYEARARSTSPAPRPPNSTLGSTAFSRGGASADSGRVWACKASASDRPCLIAVGQTARSRARNRCWRPTSSPTGRRGRSRSARSSSATSKCAARSAGLG